jgi:hypothetical protein
MKAINDFISVCKDYWEYRMDLGGNFRLPFVIIYYMVMMPWFLLMCILIAVLFLCAKDAKQLFDL